MKKKPETLSEKRRDAYLQIINRLNEEKAFYQHLFDCGDLGFALIEWYHNWNVTWFDEAESSKIEEGLFICEHAKECAFDLFCEHRRRHEPVEDEADPDEDCTMPSHCSEWTEDVRCVRIDA